jgi:helix-turn-helix protein
MTVLRFRGMSLQQFLSLRRLWLVRKQLLAGAPGVKASARAFGFWHLGDFARSYRAQFGEAPSETMARASAKRSQILTRSAKGADRPMRSGNYDVVWPLRPAKRTVSLPRLLDACSSNLLTLAAPARSGPFSEL